MQKGDKARSGREEYFKVWIFGEEDYERTISGHGESIMVYDRYNRVHTSPASLFTTSSRLTSSKGRIIPSWT
jgi:hypothetical protein